MFKEFKKFILKGSLVDLAIGFTVGASFTAVAKSLVNDIILPPINLILGPEAGSNWRIVLRPGDPNTYVNIGLFLNSLLSLLLVAIAMFVIIKIINKLESDVVVIGKRPEKIKKSEPSEKKCPFCYSNIDYRASRCPECTSQLESIEKHDKKS